MARPVRIRSDAGVPEEGQRTCSNEGTPQRGGAWLLLTDVHLHYPFDLLVQHWRKTKANGDATVVRWVDGGIVLTWL